MFYWPLLGSYLGMSDLCCSCRVLIDEAGRNRRWLHTGGMSELSVNGLGEHCELSLKYITLAAWALYIYYTLLLVGFQALGNTGGTGKKKGASLISSCLFAQVLGIKVQHNAGNVTGKLRVTFPISWNQEFLPRAPHVIFIQQRQQRVPSTSLWRPCLPPDRCSFFFFSGFDEAKSIAALRMLKQSFPFFFFFSFLCSISYPNVILYMHVAFQKVLRRKPGMYFGYFNSDALLPKKWRVSQDHKLEKKVHINGMNFWIFR